MSDGVVKPVDFLATTGFPNNIVLALRDRLLALNPDVPVFTRPIRVGDPVYAWGITAGAWLPNEDSWEMVGSRPLSSPTLNQYMIGIQSFNQNMDSVEGLQVAASMAGFVRNMLSRDADCRVQLAALTSTEFGFKESVQRFRIQGQQFMSNEIDGAFLFLTNLELVVETETR